MKRVLSIVSILELKLLRTANETMKSQLGDQVNNRTKYINTENPKRPTIEVDMDDTDWAVFNESWKRYIKQAYLEDREQIC